MGQTNLAADALQKADVSFDQGASVSQLHATVDYLLGSASFTQGELEQSKKYLQTAFEQTASMGYDHFIITEGRKSIDFLAFALKELPELKQIQSVYKRVIEFKPGMGNFISAAEDHAESKEKIRLEIEALGPGRIRLNEKMIRKSDWRATMARALFYYILDRSGETGNQIKLEFWPEKTGAKATSNFQSTLWRARKALQGLNILVLENNRYLIAPEVNIWYDVNEFENLYSRSKAGDISDSERLNLLKSAVELVKGEFLPDIFMEWANERRIQLQRMHQEILETLGEMLSARGKYSEAVRYYETLMQTDPFRDDIQLAILQCYKERGSISIAISRYKEYTKFLAVEGLMPSEELEACYLSLVRELE